MACYITELPKVISSKGSLTNTEAARPLDPTSLHNDSLSAESLCFPLWWLYEELLSVELDIHDVTRTVWALMTVELFPHHDVL